MTQDYVYVFVREDLTPSQQAVQACHACIDVARTLFPHYEGVPFLVLCGLRDEKQLVDAFERIKNLGIKCQKFREPDLDNQTTAFATGLVSGDDRRLFRKYRLLKIDTAPLFLERTTV